MIANGERREDPKGASLADWLSSNGYDSKRTAVLVNGEVVPKRDYPGTALRDTDVLEIVSFVGGG